MANGLKTAAAVVALCGLSTIVSADVLYSQAPHTPGAAGANGVSSFEGLLGTLMYDREAADDFNVPAGGWQINRVSISAVQSTAGDPNAVTGADIRFFQSNGGSVGALLATATVNTVTRSTGAGTYFGRPEQILAFDINSVALPAGSYFIQVQPQVNHNWFWLTSTPTTPVAGSAVQIQRGVLTTAGNDATWPGAWMATGPANPIFTTAYDVNFTLEGVVPAPGTLALLGFGGLIAARRRRA